MVKPETGQAKRSENRIRSWVSFFDLLAEPSEVSAIGNGLSANSAMALPSADDRRQEVEPRTVRHFQNTVDHLGHRLALDRQPGRWRIGHADARKEQTHIVVDLGHRADR